MQNLAQQQTMKIEDTLATKIASFSDAEREFYTECAELVGETIDQWVSHMDEV